MKSVKPPPNQRKAVATRASSSQLAYTRIRHGIEQVLDSARSTAARSVNTLMTASYWEIGRRIVEAEQQGLRRAGYGDQLIAKLAVDLTTRFGRGFSARNLAQMRQFHLSWPILQTVSAKSIHTSGKTTTKPILQTLSAKLVISKSSALSSQMLPPTRAVDPASLDDLAQAFPLPWSAYVRLLSVDEKVARDFYEIEALRGGWSVRQIDRQISSQFYERTALSRDKIAMLSKGAKARASDIVTPEQALKDPYFLEFLNLKDEYSETDLEAALIAQLEEFLMELGSDFAFVGRQRRLRIDNTWYRVDLLFFHRRLRCLVIIDLKLGELTHSDVGQMNLYCNYAKRNWMMSDESPPVGIILCADRGHEMAQYAFDGLPNQVMAAKYKTVLPKPALLQAQIQKARQVLESRLGVYQDRQPAKKSATKSIALRQRKSP